MTSVVVPAFNAERTLGGCLAALARQTAPPGEVIVVDDGSTDKTADVARECGVRVLRQRNQGPAAARNEGARCARGEIVLFTDADCVPAPDWVAEMTAPFSDPAVSGVKGVYRCDQRERIARLAQCEFEERYERLSRFERIDFVDTYSAAFRLDAFRALGGFPPGFPEANNEDVEFSYRLAKAGHRLVFNPRAAVTHRHQASWRSYFRLKVRRGHWRMVVYRLHPAKAVSDTYTPNTMKAQVALAGIVALGLAAAPFDARALWLAVAAAALMAASAAAFARLVGRRDRDLVPWVLPFVLVRAAAFAVGIVTGLVAAARYRPAGSASSS